MGFIQAISNFVWHLTECSIQSRVEDQSSDSIMDSTRGIPSNDDLFESFERNVKVVNGNLDWAKNRLQVLHSAGFRDDCIAITEEFKEGLMPQEFGPSGCLEVLTLPYTGEMRDTFESETYGQD